MSNVNSVSLGTWINLLDTVLLLMKLNDNFILNLMIYFCLTNCLVFTLCFNKTCRSETSFEDYFNLYC